MSSNSFRFRRFTVWHDRCPMKVGTDGVLLGAWAPIDISRPPRRILDIGTGSGLVALMLAQRIEDMFPETDWHIDAIDILPEVVRQAHANFLASPWAGHLSACLSSVQDYTSACPASFDLIVSNPPFFNDSLKNPQRGKEVARHADSSLSYADLFSSVACLLADVGFFMLILPYGTEKEVDSLAVGHDMFVRRMTYVRSKEGREPKRIMYAIQKQAAVSLFATCQPLCDSICLLSPSGERSAEYAALTADFYL